MNCTKVGPPSYNRARDLPRLLGCWPNELTYIGGAELEVIVDRLAAAIRAERRRAMSRHWSYDLNRHWALIRAHEAEREALRRHQRRKALEKLRERGAFGEDDGGQPRHSNSG